MPRAVLTVAEVFRRYGDTFRAEVGAALSTAHSRVMTAIEQCRTAALGGHVEQCDHCGHRRVWYNSCRNRHCPTCQSLARATWLERRRADLLPTEYFHVVFTVPPAIAEIAAQNKAVVYGLLFRTVAETLRTIAADPRHLGAELGFFAVLHTWGQTLVHHPHLHCVIPGGVDPIPWTPILLARRRSPQCRSRDRRTRRHSDSRWSSWFGPDVHRESWLGSSSRRPRRYETGSRRLVATPESGPTA